ncbi:siroheme synthase [Sulfurimicrobium lacus]|uniref:Siroheme synthase n=1 Tax=Sulfurimicrobium lacus TaxID=2715678 RepID=A0A6F8VGK0_9PROT|nr:siroheme synthase CysG [Sulfurimicrobium lacus]BCB28291.1 siroheme synthase [Sulfurimicrobium lacus]
MEFLPIFFDIKGQPCCVIGGGDVAARKVAMLLHSGGKVTVVAPQLCATLKGDADKGIITYVQETFSPEHLNQAVIAIAATNDRAVNKRVSEVAKAHHIPVNVVDDPEFCSFIMPSVIDRSPVIVAVSTGGASPVLARLLRARLETLVPASYGRLASLAEKFRGKVKQHFSESGQRRIFWEKVFQGPIAEMIFAGQEEQAKGALEKAITESADTPPQGEVYLVGGGPGNPDLLTFRALRLMQQADVIVYDNLVTPQVLELTRRDADRIFVGKQRANHAMRQEEINELLVKLAKEGKRVLRLKGGDPFIFGRGGEEIETLSANQVPFQVVPGITAASGVASYAGIPLTHRDYAQACVFVTGHLKDGTMDLDWDMLARPNQTVVIYMGLLGLPVLCQQLITHGLTPSTPAAIVQQGTTPSQRVVTGTLESLPRLATDARLKPPTLIIVGKVVSLQSKLAWFKPDQGSEGNFALTRNN